MKKKIKSILPTSKTSKIKITNQVASPSINDNKKLIDTSFVDRILEKKLAKKNKKPKHTEQDFAAQPAPRAEKRKRLLAVASSSTLGNTAEVIDNEIVKAKKEKSGGRSKPKVNKKKITTTIFYLNVLCVFLFSIIVVFDMIKRELSTVYFVVI